MKVLNRIIVILFLSLLASCTDDTLRPFPDGAHNSAKREGVEGLGYSRVMILYFEGYNNLSADLNDNIAQLCEGYLPEKNEDRAVLVYSHIARNRIDWSTPTEPVIFHMYKHYGQVVMDTLKRYPSDQISVKTSMAEDVLGFIKKEFPSPSYGLVFNSHASGWLPSGYNYGNGDATPSTSPSWMGAQYDRTSANAYYMDVKDFADVLPMTLDYIIFDCCLMGGVETCYDLREKVKYIAAAPTEVISYGFDYRTMASRLLDCETIDVEGVCQDFYDKLSSSSYLTVGLYDCSVMDELAGVCQKIFANHPNASLDVERTEVQSYNYSFSYHYDFRDIIAKMGASADELKELDQVLEKLVLYKNATPTFIGTPINKDTFSGLSMYLPRNNWPTLNSLYKQTLWNQKTTLLE